MHKTHQHRTTFGSWKLWSRKSARCCGAKHIWKSNAQNTSASGLRSTFRSCDVEKAHGIAARSTFESEKAKNNLNTPYAVVAQSTFRSQNVQSTTCSRHFWTLKRRFLWQAQGIVHLVKSEKTWGFCSISKKRWQAWDIWNIYLKRIAFSVAGAVQETCSSEMLGGSLPELLRFWCCHPQKFSKSRRIASFLMLPTSKHWGSLAELLPFWRYQVQKLRKSRRIASFSSLQIADRQIDR